MGDPLSSLIGIWLFIAIGAAAVGSRGAAGKVLAAPFRFIGWVLRGVVGAAGQGARTVIASVWHAFVRLMSDGHRHLYGRWPGITLICYTLIILAVVWYIKLR